MNDCDVFGTEVREIETCSCPLELGCCISQSFLTGTAGEIVKVGTPLWFTGVGDTVTVIPGAMDTFAGFSRVQRDPIVVGDSLNVLIKGDFNATLVNDIVPNFTITNKVDLIKAGFNPKTIQQRVTP